MIVITIGLFMIVIGVIVLVYAYSLGNGASNFGTQLVFGFLAYGLLLIGLFMVVIRLFVFWVSDRLLSKTSNTLKYAIMNALREQQINKLNDLIELKADSKSITDIDYLKHCTNLTILDLEHNLISDISPLSALANLKHLTLNNNRISDISPLVENSGIGEGDIINISNNKLDLAEGSEDMANIKALQDRGVEVIY